MMKNAANLIIGSELARNFVKVLLGYTQLFGEDFSGHIAFMLLLAIR